MNHFLEVTVDEKANPDISHETSAMRDKEKYLRTYFR